MTPTVSQIGRQRKEAKWKGQTEVLRFNGGTATGLGDRDDYQRIRGISARTKIGRAVDKWGSSYL